jgi:hypothetical protein
MFSHEDKLKPLVVVGSINADLVIEVKRLPKPGETLAGGAMNVYPGGKVCRIYTSIHENLPRS